MSTFPPIPVTVLWTATLAKDGSVSGTPTCSFTPDPVSLPYNGMAAADAYTVFWNLVAVDQDGEPIKGVTFESKGGIKPEYPYPVSWGQPFETSPTQYALPVNNGNTSGQNEPYPYEAVVQYRNKKYTYDPEIVFETQA